MTKKLYENDGHRREFEATVSDVRPYKDSFGVILDETAFFPEGGGQAADEGTLAGINVCDVRNVEGEILHIMEAPLEKGSRVKGVIDYAKRFDRMQQHSGEHIVSGLVHQTFGYNNVGFHLSDETVTLDFDGPLSEDDLRDIEARANKAVWANTEVEIFYPTAEALKDIDYRSKKVISGQVRLVRFPGSDLCACCAPHVARTGEIGLIKFVDAINYKGGIRLSIRCGKRALEDYRQKDMSVKALSHMLSVKEDKVTEAVQKVMAEREALKASLENIKKRMIREEAEKYQETEGLVVLFYDALSSEEMRLMVNAVKEGKAAGCALFKGTPGDYTFNISLKAGDARVYAAALREQFGAKGGGKPEMVQGKTSGTKEDLTDLMERIYKEHR